MGESRYSVRTVSGLSCSRRVDPAVPWQLPLQHNASAMHTPRGACMMMGLMSKQDERARLETRSGNTHEHKRTSSCSSYSSSSLSNTHTRSLARTNKQAGGWAKQTLKHTHTHKPMQTIESKMLFDRLFEPPPGRRRPQRRCCWRRAADVPVCVRYSGRALISTHSLT